MKRSGHLNKKKKWSTLLTAGLLFTVTIAGMLSSGMDINEFTQRAALLSAMANMPDGSVEMLLTRFGDEAAAPANSAAAQSNIPSSGAPDNSPSLAAESSAPARPLTPNDTTPAVPGSVRPAIKAPSPAADPTPNIAEAYQGTLLQENMAGSGTNLLEYGVGLLRNSTEMANAEVLSIMQQGMNIVLEDTPEPQVLIVHTHATESFEPFDSEIYDTRNSWRSTDNTKNMVAVGNAIEKQLKDAGIGVIHDTTKHDYPSYNGSYERSAATVNSYLEKHPTIKIVLDIHRDGIQRENDVIVKPVTEINGKKAAQLMIITGCDDGTMNVPEWRENLRFAASLQNAIEEDYPHLTRPIFFCYRKYNMDLTTGSLLLEVGANGNTLDEAVYTGELVGKSLARLLTETQAPEG